MNPKFIPKQVEECIYRSWEKNGLHKSDKGKPFTILMPPPNANASLHAGHGMYTVEDVLIRYMRLRGFASLWVPGMDHAGFETQYVYEKHLAKEGKSRLDFDRETLYKNIFDFVKKNSGLIYTQFKRLGFIADWERSVFTLDPHVLRRVFATFQKMEKEGLVYKDNYLVNYCNYCGTSLAELEVEHVERTNPLYYMKYGPFILATVRPETKFGDTAVAVNPKDKRYKKWIGKTIEVEGLIGKFNVKVIADDFVDPKFGTGVVKVTPAHDFNDYDMAKRHNLPIKQVIDIYGRLNHLTGPYQGLKVKVARLKVAEDMKKSGMMEKIDENYVHSVAVCYKCKRDLEPSLIPNWYIKVKSLKEPVIDAVNKNKIKLYPSKFKKQLLDWMNIMHDWPISRQIAWGIRMPVWYDVAKNKDIDVVFLDSNRKSVQGIIGDVLKKYSLEDVEKGLQRLSADKKASYIVSEKKPKGNYLQETDTFDTWFSSGQWPLVTLKESEYKTRFPTDVMGTSHEILKIWVSRMIMFSLYIRKEVPFKNVYLWPMVTDLKGQKMSKSKGNVINPIDLVNNYGADALRGSLFFGISEGGNVNLAEEKIVGMRNFANKIWNIGRFIEMNQSQSGRTSAVSSYAKASEDKEEKDGLDHRSFSEGGKTAEVLVELAKEFRAEKKEYSKLMNSYKFSQAFGLIYEFVWHRFADYYIEQLKDAMRNGNIKVLENLKEVYFQNLIRLHPYMPFVTEAVWKVFHGEKSTILAQELSFPRPAR